MICEPAFKKRRTCTLYLVLREIFREPVLSRLCQYPYKWKSHKDLWTCLCGSWLKFHYKHKVDVHHSLLKMCNLKCRSISLMSCYKNISKKIRAEQYLLRLHTCICQNIGSLSFQSDKSHTARCNCWPDMSLLVCTLYLSIYNQRSFYVNIVAKLEENCAVKLHGF